MTPERRQVPRCEAYRCNDEMRCRCGLIWARDDTDPPACGRATEQDRRAAPAKDVPK